MVPQNFLTLFNQGRNQRRRFSFPFLNEKCPFHEGKVSCSTECWCTLKSLKSAPGLPHILNIPLPQPGWELLFNTTFLVLCTSITLLAASFLKNYSSCSICCIIYNKYCFMSQSQLDSYSCIKYIL